MAVRQHQDPAGLEDNDNHKMTEYAEVIDLKNPVTPNIPLKIKANLYFYVFFEL